MYFFVVLYHNLNRYQAQSKISPRDNLPQFIVFVTKSLYKTEEFAWR